MSRKTNVRSYERRDGTKVTQHERSLYSENVPLVHSQNYSPPKQAEEYKPLDYAGVNDPQELVGMVFFTSWGYDQTNYDFIAVESVSKTGKTATCKMARLESNELRDQYWEQTPSQLGYGDSFRMKIDMRSNGKVVLRGSYPFIDGDMSRGKRLDTFFPHQESRTYFETDPRFGH